VGIQRGGGILGKRVVPNVFAASGIWSLPEAEAAARDASWPVPSPVTSGLQLWLDGADRMTMYDATSGGSPVAVDGAIARWQDKSGNARHFTQATSGLRPTRRAGVKNLLGAVEFTNDWMSGTYTYAVGSVFVVWNHPTTVSNDTFPAIVSARTSSAFKTGNSSLSFTLTLPGANNVALDPNPGVSTNRLNGTTPALSFGDFGSGVGVRTSPDRWQYMSATFTAVAGSKPFVLGADTFPATGRTMQNGHIGEILIYSTALTLAQVLAVEAYLVNKWGLV
jgi:hypothetical protein